MQWLTDARPVLLIGQTGVGKTFIAQALGLQACPFRLSTLAISASGQMRASERTGSTVSGRVTAVLAAAPSGDAQLCVYTSRAMDH